MSLPVLFAALILVAAYLAALAVRAGSRLAARLSALAAACLFMPLAYAGFAELLSRPKPAALEWWLGRADEATVLASSLREGLGIYLWLQLDGAAEPRAYVLPWNRSLAEELQAALRAADERRTQVRMRLPFEPTLDDEAARFYAMPQPPSPAKPDAAPPPPLSRGPASEA